MAGVALACAAVSSSPPSARAAGGCTVTYRFFRIDRLTLHESITSHFVDDADGHDKTAIDTVERADVSQAVPRPAAAERRKFREIAFFYQLISGCAVQDLNLGFLERTIPVHYSLSGTWTTTGATGTCDDSATRKTKFHGTWMRPTRSRKFYPPPSRAALELGFADHSSLGCTYEFPSDTGEGYGHGGLGNYQSPDYGLQRIVMPAATLLRRPVVTIPFHFHHTGRSTWLRGHVTSDATASGTLTLRRYKSCTLLPSSPIGAYCPS
jgi:hypothetical protein